MDIHGFLVPPAELARRKGPYDRIVMSSRVRLARNIKDAAFPGWAKNPNACMSSSSFAPPFKTCRR